MACDGSYTVFIVPLQNSLYSSDALRYFHWLKKLRALEREKDSLWSGLQVLEQARFWYQHQLDHVSQRHARMDTREHDEEDEGRSCALRSFMQRVNGSLGSLLNNAYVCSVAPDEKDGSDWYLRWKNATLTQEVSQKNSRISMLEFEKEILIQQQDRIHYF
ncbi:suppressor APC domain-containing protein 1 isoform X1 [Ictalurus punctatus]|uniref:Suppressor APC domain-containing protein 1 isoform X1 n=1 Tax=Ictalurus punctatus TaxID=7998 RepID=A0A9F7RUB8_ICTPU|nr:suppressor APC domain-containing protein 1 isoform X1 [Ictalurus punctatus]